LVDLPALLTGTNAARAAVAAFFAALLVLGLCIYKDYGLSWDEEMSRVGNGYLNYTYIRTGDARPLLEGSEKYHGPAFEILLVVLEKLVNHGDVRKIYFLRHLVTFLTFYAAVFVFYRLLRERFGSRGLGLCGAAFLVLSPRIFADAFYNSKDLVFLSCYVLTLYTLLRFHRKMTYGSAAAHALACGFLIGVRILGVVLPVLSLALAAAAWTVDRWTGGRRVRPLCVLAYVVLLVGFTVLFWPVLWLGPVQHFANAFVEMRRYHWDGVMLYCGAMVRAGALPWHYLPVWMAVTTPIVYTFFFFLGLACLLGSVVRRPLCFSPRRQADVVVLLALVLPLAAVIGLHSVVYNGWRHMYFVYPPFLYVAVLGLAATDAGVRRLGRWLPLARPLWIAATLLAVAATGVVMVRDHPYQNVYFNRLAGRDLRESCRRFDVDYWGLSYRRGLEYLLEHDPRPVIAVAVDEYPGQLNQQMLPPRQRNRLRYTTADAADYWLTTFRRRRREDYVPGQEFFAVRVGGEKILLVDKLR
jgi:hypothetical protein